MLPCVCPKDEDGRCHACLELTYSAFIEYAHAAEGLARAVNEVCKGCYVASVDHAVARFIKDLIEQGAVPGRLSFARGFIVGFKATCGLTHTPLLDLELRKLEEAERHTRPDRQA